jgi:hypothetical protein
MNVEKDTIIMTQTINCAVECTQGCKLGDQCPSAEARAQASQFIETKSLDQILALAEESVRRKSQERSSSAGPQWVFPEDGIQP